MGVSFSFLKVLSGRSNLYHPARPSIRSPHHTRMRSCDLCPRLAHVQNHVVYLYEHHAGQVNEPDRRFFHVSVDTRSDFEVFEEHNHKYCLKKNCGKLLYERRTIQEGEPARSLALNTVAAAIPLLRCQTSLHCTFEPSTAWAEPLTHNSNFLLMRVPGRDLDLPTLMLRGLQKAFWGRRRAREW